MEFTVHHGDVVNDSLLVYCEPFPSVCRLC